MSSHGRLFLCSYGTGNLDLLPVGTLAALTSSALVIAPIDAPLGLRGLAATGAVWLDMTESAMLTPDNSYWITLEQTLAENGSVTRLYAEDPLSHPIGVEEALAFAAAGLPIEVIPGPSLVLTAAAYAGLPVASVVSAADLVSDAMLSPSVTHSCGLTLDDATDVTEVQAALLAAGWPEETPCALVQDVALPSQTVVTGSLQRMTPGRPGRAVFIVGPAVRRPAELGWFEQLQLFGKRVLVTRAREQAEEFSRPLRRLGAEPVELPAIEIQPPVDLASLDRAVQRANAYDWVVFTSANGVGSFFDRVDVLGLDARILGKSQIAAIGSSTAARLREYNLRADFVPERFIAEEVLAGLVQRGISRARVLLPRAAQARDVLPDGLRAAGAEVDAVAAYRTVIPTPDPAVLRRLEAGEIDIVTFTSSSTVNNLLSMLGGRTDVLQRSLIACIGPITAETSRAAGLQVDLVATEYSIPGLIDVLTQATERSLA